MLRFLGINAAIGMAAGFAVLAALFVFDTGGIAGLILRAEHPLLPLVAIGVPLCATFGGAAAASAIMLMPYRRKYTDDLETEA
jgi:hypothetical protein